MFDKVLWSRMASPDHNELINSAYNEVNPEFVAIFIQ